MSDFIPSAVREGIEGLARAFFGRDGPAGAESAKVPRRDGIALALGGGAALGWAHIGVLRVLQEENVPVAAVSGTSIGALAALCFAADRLDVLEEIARGATRVRVLSYLDPHIGREAMLGGRRIARELAMHFGERRFEDMPMPTSVIAADLLTGEEVRLASGPVVDAVAASMALPGIFRPVKRDGRTLVDGGMVANVPVGAVRELAPGAPVVAVHLMDDYEGYVASLGPGPYTALRTLRMAFLMMAAKLDRQSLFLDRPEVLIAPRLGRFGTGAFTRAAELIEIGREAVTAALPAIRAAQALP